MRNFLAKSESNLVCLKPVLLQNNRLNLRVVNLQRLF